MMRAVVLVLALSSIAVVLQVASLINPDEVQPIDAPTSSTTSSTSTTAPPPPPPTTLATTTTAPTRRPEVPKPATTAPMTVSSTAYCETGRMANGELAYDGAVSSNFLPRGSVWRVLTGLFAGRTFTVKDTGPLASFDIAMPGRCADANRYGRHDIQIEPAL
jgi:hypothetical protein